MTSDNCPLLTYRVRVGHHEFRVIARDAAEAVELTRRLLVRELPRLYDVIHNLSKTRFEVENAA